MIAKASLGPVGSFHETPQLLLRGAEWALPHHFEGSLPSRHSCYSMKRRVLRYKRVSYLFVKPFKAEPLRFIADASWT